MILLSGAEITVRHFKDGEEIFYVAFVYVGANHTEATDKDPARAIGKAIMKQAGYTTSKLKKELDQARQEKEIPKNTNFIPKKDQTDFLSD